MDYYQIFKLLFNIFFTFIRQITNLENFERSGDIYFKALGQLYFSVFKANKPTENTLVWKTYLDPYLIWYWAQFLLGVGVKNKF